MSKSTLPLENRKSYFNTSQNKDGKSEQIHKTKENTCPKMARYGRGWGESALLSKCFHMTINIEPLTGKSYSLTSGSEGVVYGTERTKCECLAL